jgi:hypothetical protein
MDIKYFYENTELTIRQISNTLKLPFNRVRKYIIQNYSSDYRKKRKSVCYRNSKVGILNPMTDKKLENHPRYVGDVSDSKGYLLRVKPEWYTGRKKSHHVFAHHVVVCENLGITEIPRGWCVHHCDHNPLNNSFDNLVLLSMRDHMRLHTSLKGVTTIPKGSTLEWVETHGTPWKRNDIV